MIVILLQAVFHVVVIPEKIVVYKTIDASFITCKLMYLFQYLMLCLQDIDVFAKKKP